MEEAFGDIDVDACQGWIRHSKRYLPRCLAKEEIICHVDTVLWPDAYLETIRTVIAILYTVFCLSMFISSLVSLVLRINRFVSPLQLCSYLQQAINENTRGIRIVCLKLAHIIRKVPVLKNVLDKLKKLKKNGEYFTVKKIPLSVPVGSPSVM